MGDNVVQGTNHINVGQWNNRGKANGWDKKFGTMHINVQDPDYFTYDGSDALEEFIGVEMAQHFSVRAGLKPFGDRCDKTVNK